MRIKPTLYVVTILTYSCLAGCGESTDTSGVDVTNEPSCGKEQAIDPYLAALQCTEENNVEGYLSLFMERDGTRPDQATRDHITSYFRMRRLEYVFYERLQAKYGAESVSRFQSPQVFGGFKPIEVTSPDSLDRSVSYFEFSEDGRSADALRLPLGVDNFDCHCVDGQWRLDPHSTPLNNNSTEMLLAQEKAIQRGIELIEISQSLEQIAKGMSDRLFEAMREQ